ncbi:MAG: hypothetical protein JO056_08975 [Alphaproteobacteria bacterium]|nr:hypothetical protein [Alphaproteobacteria bacterium]
MDSGGAKLWDDMLEEFRALGGTAENVCLKDGRYGRGLFPIDPAKPVDIHIPESLLLESKHVTVENGSFCVGAGATIGVREKSFLENYEREFSWGVASHETEGLLRMFHAAPAELSELLKSPFNLDLWLQEPTTEAIVERYFASRIIRYKDKTVVMPIVELANHGLESQYKTGGGVGVGIGGRFENEVLVSYSGGDPLLIFRNWGFASRVQGIGLSLSLAFNEQKLRIGRSEPKPADGRNSLVPEVGTEDGMTVLSHILLGNKRNPRVPRGIFYRVCREAGIRDAAELFDRIQHINRTQYLRLAELSETASPRLGRLLRNLAYAQLEVLSFSFGVREL